MRIRAMMVCGLLLAGCGGTEALSSGNGDGGGDHCAPEYASRGDGHVTTTTICVTPNTQVGPTTTPRSPNTPIDICHKEGDGWTVITIPAKDIEVHLAHGDIYPVPRRGCPTIPTVPTVPTIPPTSTTTPGGGGGTTTTIPGGGGTTTTTPGGGGGTTTTTTPGGGGSTTTTIPTGGGGTTTTTSTTPGRTTTTTQPPATTTTLPATFQFSGAATVCRSEVPTIVIDFAAPGFPSLAGRVGILTMSDINGNVVSTQELVYQPGAHYELLYPGTRVNADGSIADVPGWNLTNAGLWVRDPADEFLREGILLTYTVNPTATAFITYPPESSACANPENTPRPPTTRPGLPFTL